VDLDGTLIPVHDQSITAISKTYRRSVNTQIIISLTEQRGRRRPMLARQPQRRHRRPPHRGTAAR
jgi:hypothetical protein